MVNNVTNKYVLRQFTVRKGILSGKLITVPDIADEGVMYIESRPPIGLQL